jgi:glyoxylate/hydroxypyruvate reductase A
MTFRLMQRRNAGIVRVDTSCRMRVLLYVHQDGGQADSNEWLQQLRAHLTEADIQLWRDVAFPVECDYAVVWKAPKDLLQALAEQKRIKAIFNLGAGVDAVLAHGCSSLAARVPIVRIDDGGMAEQMSDYVTAAILRYYRSFHTYAAQQQSASWKPQLHVEKSAFPVGILGFGILSRFHDARSCCCNCYRLMCNLTFAVTGMSLQPCAVLVLQCAAGSARPSVNLWFTTGWMGCRTCCATCVPLFACCH